MVMFDDEKLRDPLGLLSGSKLPTSQPDLKPGAPVNDPLGLLQPPKGSFGIQPFGPFAGGSSQQPDILDQIRNMFQQVVSQPPLPQQRPERSFMGGMPLEGISPDVVSQAAPPRNPPMVVPENLPLSGGVKPQAPQKSPVDVVTGAAPQSYRPGQITQDASGHEIIIDRVRKEGIDYRYMHPSYEEFRTGFAPWEGNKLGDPGLNKLPLEQRHVLGERYKAPEDIKGAAAFSARVQETGGQLVAPGGTQRIKPTTGSALVDTVADTLGFFLGMVAAKDPQAAFSQMQGISETAAMSVAPQVAKKLGVAIPTVERAIGAAGRIGLMRGTRAWSEGKNDAAIAKEFGKGALLGGTASGVSQLTGPLVGQAIGKTALADNARFFQGMHESGAFFSILSGGEAALSGKSAAETATALGTGYGLGAIYGGVQNAQYLKLPAVKEALLRRQGYQQIEDFTKFSQSKEYQEFARRVVGKAQDPSDPSSPIGVEFNSKDLGKTGLWVKQLPDGKFDFKIEESASTNEKARFVFETFLKMAREYGQQNGTGKQHENLWKLLGDVVSSAAKAPAAPTPSAPVDPPAAPSISPAPALLGAGMAPAAPVVDVPPATIVDTPVAEPEVLERGFIDRARDRVAEIIESPAAREERRMYQRQAQLDDLTGLQNQRSFRKAKSAVDKNPERSWVFIDLRNFHPYNRVLGNEAGDDKLQEIGAILQQEFGDAAFRTGGDEFSIAVSSQEAPAVSQRLSEVLVDEQIPGTEYVFGYDVGHGSTFKEANQMSTQVKQARKDAAARPVDTPVVPEVAATGEVVAPPVPAIPQAQEIPRAPVIPKGPVEIHSQVEEGAPSLLDRFRREMEAAPSEAEVTELKTIPTALQEPEPEELSAAADRLQQETKPISVLAKKTGREVSIPVKKISREVRGTTEEAYDALEWLGVEVGDDAQLSFDPSNLERQVEVVSAALDAYRESQESWGDTPMLEGEVQEYFDRFFAHDPSDEAVELYGDQVISLISELFAQSADAKPTAAPQVEAPAPKKELKAASQAIVHKLSQSMVRQGVGKEDRKLILDYASKFLGGAEEAGANVELAVKFSEQIAGQLTDKALKEHGLKPGTEAYIAGRSRIKADGKLFSATIELLLNTDEPIAESVVHEFAEVWKALWQIGDPKGYKEAVNFLIEKGLDPDRAEESLGEIIADYAMAGGGGEDSPASKIFDKLVDQFKDWVTSVLKRLKEFMERVWPNMPEDIKVKAKDFAEGNWAKAFRDMKQPKLDVTRYSVKPAKGSPFAPAFYSKLERQIQESKQNVMTKAQALSLITKGITEDELLWSGLEEYLNDYPRDKITKQELLDNFQSRELDNIVLREHTPEQLAQRQHLDEEFRKNTRARQALSWDLTMAASPGSGEALRASLEREVVEKLRTVDRMHVAQTDRGYVIYFENPEDPDGQGNTLAEAIRDYMEVRDQMDIPEPEEVNFEEAGIWLEEAANKLETMDSSGPPDGLGKIEQELKDLLSHDHFVVEQLGNGDYSIYPEDVDPDEGWVGGTLAEAVEGLLEESAHSSWDELGYDSLEAWDIARNKYNALVAKLKLGPSHESESLMRERLVEELKSERLYLRIVPQPPPGPHVVNEDLPGTLQIADTPDAEDGWNEGVAARGKTLEEVLEKYIDFIGYNYGTRDSRLTTYGNILSGLKGKGEAPTGDPVEEMAVRELRHLVTQEGMYLRTAEHGFGNYQIGFVGGEDDEDDVIGYGDSLEEMLQNFLDERAALDIPVEGRDTTADYQRILDSLKNKDKLVLKITPENAMDIWPTEVEPWQDGLYENPAYVELLGYFETYETWPSKGYLGPLTFFDIHLDKDGTIRIPKDFDAEYMGQVISRADGMARAMLERRPGDALPGSSTLESEAEEYFYRYLPDAGDDDALDEHGMYADIVLESLKLAMDKGYAKIPPRVMGKQNFLHKRLLEIADQTFSMTVPPEQVLGGIEIARNFLKRQSLRDTLGDASAVDRYLDQAESLVGEARDIQEEKLSIMPSGQPPQYEYVYWKPWGAGVEGTYFENLFQFNPGKKLVDVMELQRIAQTHAPPLRHYLGDEDDEVSLLYGYNDISDERELPYLALAFGDGQSSLKSLYRNFADSRYRDLEFFSYDVLGDSIEESLKDMDLKIGKGEEVLGLGARTDYYLRVWGKQTVIVDKDYNPLSTNSPWSEVLAYGKTEEEAFQMLRNLQQAAQAVDRALSREDQFVLSENKLIKILEEGGMEYDHDGDVEEEGYIIYDGDGNDYYATEDGSFFGACKEFAERYDTGYIPDLREVDPSTMDTDAIDSLLSAENLKWDQLANDDGTQRMGPSQRPIVVISRSREDRALAHGKTLTKALEHLKSLQETALKLKYAMEGTKHIPWYGGHFGDVANLVGWTRNDEVRGTRIKPNGERERIFRMGESQSDIHQKALGSGVRMSRIPDNWKVEKSDIILPQTVVNGLNDVLNKYGLTLRHQNTRLDGSGSQEYRVMSRTGLTLAVGNTPFGAVDNFFDEYDDLSKKHGKSVGWPNIGSEDYTKLLNEIGIFQRAHSISLSEAKVVWDLLSDEGVLYGVREWLELPSTARVTEAYTHPQFAEAVLGNLENVGTARARRITKIVEKAAEARPIPRPAWVLKNEKGDIEEVTLEKDGSHGFVPGAREIPSGASRKQVQDKFTSLISSDNRAAPAPFSKTWAEYFFKYGLRLAAESGHDAFVFTDGDVQAERSSPFTHGVSKVKWSKKEITRRTDPHSLIQYVKDNNSTDSKDWKPEYRYTLFASMEDGAYKEETDVTAGRLRDLIGGLSKSIIDSPDLWGELQPETSIALGGHDKRETYGVITKDGRYLPGLFWRGLRKHLSKLGMEFELIEYEEEVLGQGGYKPGRTGETQKRVSPGVRIPPEAKDKILYEGQPMSVKKKDFDAILETYKKIHWGADHDKKLPEDMEGKFSKEQKDGILKARNEVRKSLQQNLRPEYKKEIESLLNELDWKVSKRSKKKLDRLSATHDFLEKNPDASMPQYVLDELKLLNRIPLKDLSYDEIMLVFNSVKHLAKLNELKNKLIIGGQIKELKKTVEEANRLVKEAQPVLKTFGQDARVIDTRMQKGPGALQKIFTIDSYQPELLAQLVQGKEDGVISDLFYKGIDKGFTEKYELWFKAQDSLRKSIGKTDVTSWSHLFNKKSRNVKLVNLKLPSGKVTKITPAERMSLYLHSLHPYNRENLVNSGFRFPHKEGVLNKITLEDLKFIIDSMPPEEKRIADAGLEYLNTTQKEELNRVSLKLDGYEIATVSPYWPLHRSKIRYREQPPTDLQGRNFTHRLLENMGLLQTRQDVNMPVLLRDFFDSLILSIQDASSYVGFAEPVRNARFLLRDEEFMANLNKVGMKDYYEALEKYIGDIEGNISKLITIDKLTLRLLNPIHTAILGFNPWVILKQPASYMLAATEIDVKYLNRAIPTKVDWDEIKKYSPQMRYRDEGKVTREMGEIGEVGIGLQFFTGKTFMSMKFTDGIQRFDKLTVGRIWNAVKAETKDKHPNLSGDKFLEHVARKTEHILNRTQPTYLPHTRSAVGRSSSPWVRGLAPFHTQRNKNYNVTVREWWKYQKSEKKPKDRANLMRSLFILMIAVPAYIIGVDELRDRFYGREINRNFFTRATKMVSSALSNAYVVGNIFDSIISKMDQGKWAGFDVIDPFKSTLWEGVDAVVDVFNAIDDVVTKEEYQSGAKKGEKIWRTSVLRAIDSVSLISTKMLGIPYGNVQRVVESLVKKASPEMEFALESLTQNPQQSYYYDRLWDRLESGNERGALEAMKVLVKQFGVSGKGIESSFRSRELPREYYQKATQLYRQARREGGR